MDPVSFIVGAAAALIGLVIGFVLKTSGANRIESALRGEHEARIERTRRDHEVTAMKLREEIATLTTALDEAKADDETEETEDPVLVARRLDATRDLWSSLLAIDDVIPEFMLVDDLVPETQYHRMLSYKSPLREADAHDFVRRIRTASHDAETARPFVDDVIYELFAAYRSIVSATVKHFIDGYKSGQIGPWHNGTREMLVDILPHELMLEFDRVDQGRLRWCRDTIKDRIVALARTGGDEDSIRRPAPSIAALDARTNESWLTEIMPEHRERERVRATPVSTRPVLQLNPAKRERRAPALDIAPRD